MIKEIKYSEAKEFIDSQKTDSYLQRAEVYNLSPDKIKFLGYYENEKLSACCSYYDVKVKKIFKAAMLIKSEVFSSINEENIKKYYNELIKYFSSYLYLDIFPVFIKNYRDNEGNIVKESENKKWIDKVLNGINAVFPKREEFLAANAMYVKRTNSFELDNITDGMGSNVKKLLKQSKNKELYIKEIQVDRLPDYYYIFEESANKQGFNIPSIEKLTQQLEVYKDSMKLVAVCVDKNKSIARLEKLMNDKNADSEHIKNYSKLLSFFSKQKEDDVALGIAVFYQDNNQISYEISGSLSMFNNWGVVYYLMIEEMKKAKELGLEYYNFGGLVTTFNGDDLHNDGVYKFKKKFNGEIIEYYPEIIIPIKSLLCKILKI